MLRLSQEKREVKSQGRNGAAGLGGKVNEEIKTKNELRFSVMVTT